MLRSTANDMNLFQTLLAALLIALCANYAASADSKDDSPRTAVKSPVSPEDSLQHIEVHPGLKIELVAAEPEVIDPVAIAFDERGRMWVAEMRDYPNGPAPGETPQSCIKYLEDKDHDGTYETATLFADKLLFANGVQPWKGGVIVTLAGEVAWLCDTDNDGRADVKQTWFTGFMEENPQLRANHPTFGFDNHIYVANGLRGGDVIARKSEWAGEAKPVSISGMDFRFDPLRGTYEAVTGIGQFGLTFDNFGNRFLCSNRNPCIHVILEDCYLKRNPFFTVTTGVHDVSPAAGDSRVYPLTSAWTTSNLHSGQFTAACGVMIYRDQLLPEEFHGNSFTCEPTGNLVHRDVLTADGVTFKSRPGREGVEFLASRDNWFRPVNLSHGPDGAIYVVDMYRAVIEHPQFMPDELKQRPDLTLGNDRGRIYRIVPNDDATSPESANRRRAAGVSPPVKPPSINDALTWLEHKNAWQRDTALRLTYESQDKALVPELQRIARQGASPETRFAVLCALDGLNSWSPDIASFALVDESPRVRELAAKLSEQFIGNAEIRTRIENLLRDHDPRVRFQAILSLGEAKAGLPAWFFQNISLEGTAPWVQAAILSSSSGHETDLLDQILINRRHSEVRAASLEVQQFVEQICEVIGSRQKEDEIKKALHLLRGLAPAPGSRPLLCAGIGGLGRGAARRGVAIQPYFTDDWNKIWIVIADSAANSRLADSERLTAIAALRYGPFEQTKSTLLKLAADRQNQAVRLASIEAVSHFASPEIADTLLADFGTETPATRRAILDALLSNSERTVRLLDELEQGSISAGDFDATRSARLTKHRDAAIRERALKFFNAALPADRTSVLSDYAAAATMPSDIGRGRKLFEQHCATCHRVGNLGVDIGPDISDSRTQTLQQLLTNVLDPNRAVDSNYFSYTVVTQQGTVFTGLIANETAVGITLKQAENKQITLLREDIDEMKSDGVSLMPVGFENKLSKQDIADVISFVKNWRYLDGEGGVLKSN